jgi:hypothetical protein
MNQGFASQMPVYRWLFDVSTGFRGDLSALFMRVFKSPHKNPLNVNAFQGLGAVPGWLM